VDTGIFEFGDYDDCKGSSGWDMWGKRLNDVAVSRKGKFMAAWQ
jgi:hypothetical protein